jgi:hypothetical protein
MAFVWFPVERSSPRQELWPTHVEGECQAHPVRRQAGIATGNHLLCTGSGPTVAAEG